MTTYVVDNLLGWLATKTEERERYLCVGSGSTTTSGSQVDLGQPCDVIDTRNKVYESGSVNGNEFFLEYRLQSTEPSGGQPAVIGEWGTFKTANDNDDMGMRFVFPTGETKDSPSEWIFRISGRVVES